DVRQSVEADIAGQHLLDGQRAAAEREDAAGHVLFLFARKKALDDANHPRMDGPHQACAGGLQGLGDEPGETFVVAYAGNEGDLAAEINTHHACVLRRRGVASWAGPPARKSVSSSTRAEAGQEQPPG